MNEEPNNQNQQPQQEDDAILYDRPAEPGESFYGGRGVIFVTPGSSARNAADAQESTKEEMMRAFDKTLAAEVEAQFDSGIPPESAGYSRAVSNGLLAILPAISALSFVALQLAAVVVFIWSIGLAYAKAGLIAAIITTVLPVISQSYWAWAFWPSTFSYAVVGCLLVSLVSPAIAVLSAAIRSRD